MHDTQAVPLNEEIDRVAAEAMQLAMRHLAAGEPDQAAALLRAVLDIQAGHPEAHYQLGQLAWQAAKLPAAAAHLTAALQGNPAEAGYWLAYIGVLLDGAQLDAARDTLALGRRHGLQGGRFDALAQRLARQERGTPSDQELAHVAALIREARHDDAELAARALIKDCPRHPYPWKALGVIHHRRGQLAEALEAMQAAAERDPDNAETLNNLGSVLKDAWRLDEAETWLRRSLALRPDNAAALTNLAATLFALTRLAEAEASARAALALDPARTLAWNTLGAVLQNQGRMVDAVAAYRRVLALDPGNTSVHSNLLFAMSQMEGVAAGELFAAHRAYGEQVEGALPSPAAYANVRDGQRPLRIGFLSGDLRDHAVASFIEPVLERLSGRPGISLHAYHNHVRFDHVSARLRGYMAEWRDVAGMSDEALEACIRFDAIDILIDLAGHTAHNRLPVMARKPAPLAATWIGYPGTTGLRAVDYYLTDRLILPPGQFDHQFTEKLVHLPVSAPFHPELGAPAVTPLPALANGYITFGSFNRISKIGRPVVAAWGALLRAVPAARLLVAGVPANGSAGQLIAMLQDEGVDATRVTLHPRTGMGDYLALHGQVDIALDTFPYSGGTTTLHALWMGVPTLTLAGDTAAGRQTVCILEHIGQQQFIANDAADFVRKGAAFAADFLSLAVLRTGLRACISLPDAQAMEQVADGVEQALRMMWQRWCDGLPAASLQVPLAAPAPPAPAAIAPIYVTQPILPPLEDFTASLRQIWDSKFLTNGGAFHQKLEAALCAHLGVEHISLFANGTLALMVALQAQGIKGEVITTPYSFVASAEAITWNGATPVFVDIDPVSFNIDPDKIEAAITPHTQAIMPVHCYGNPCDMARIEAIARKHGLAVIYDAAHAFGVRQDGRSILRHGDLAVLSFHATKVFSTIEGGAIVCRDAATKQHIDRLKNFGIADEVTVIAAGINGKMNEVSAAFGLLQLDAVDGAIAQRREVAALYRRLLADVAGITPMAELGHEANYGYFAILVGDSYPLGRDGLYHMLRDAGIHARRYFYPLISDMPVYASLPSAAPANLPHAAAVARQVLCLPIYPALALGDIARIVGQIAFGATLAPPLQKPQGNP
jgi:dTDP-4-amino-4,6-dideoxygalactose transaminase/predicted O-linked N-acetylglucosamine transferase (SPINDLY family)